GSTMVSDTPRGCAKEFYGSEIQRYGNDVRGMFFPCGKSGAKAARRAEGGGQSAYQQHEGVLRRQGSFSAKYNCRRGKKRLRGFRCGGNKACRQKATGRGDAVPSAVFPHNVCAAYVRGYGAYDKSASPFIFERHAKRAVLCAGAVFAVSARVVRQPQL